MGSAFDAGVHDKKMLPFFAFGLVLIIPALSFFTFSFSRGVLCCFTFCIDGACLFPYLFKLDLFES